MANVAALLAAIAALITAVTPLAVHWSKQRALKKRREEALRKQQPPPPLPVAGTATATVSKVSLVFLPIFAATSLFLFIRPDRQWNEAGPRPVVSTAAPAEATNSPSPPTVSPSPSPACDRPLYISRPAAGTAVDGGDGVSLDGTACNLDRRVGWLFELDTEDHYYYLAGEAPIVTSDGAWSYVDAPIGDPGDNRKRYTLTLILADPVCNAALAGAPLIDGDRKLKTFPPTCLVSQTVDVYVSNR